MPEVYRRPPCGAPDGRFQSDLRRTDWLRELLAEKARLFQIVVFTCRPGDYLAANAMAAKGKVVHRDTDDGFVRAIDLGRAVRRRSGPSASVKGDHQESTFMA